MSKFKTVTTDSSMHRIFSGQLRVCATDNKKNYKVKLMLLNEKVNENKWLYTRVAEHIHEVQDIPLLYSVINGKIGNSHDFEIVTDEMGNKYASFIGAESEHPYGWLPSVIDGKPNGGMEVVDGVEWLTANAYLPSFYNVEMIKELERNGNQMPISIETLVSKSHYEGDVEVEDEYSIVGVTILGVTTKPAVKNANIRKLSVGGDELKEIKLRVASLSDEFNTEPQTQKQNQNSKKGATRTMAKVLNLEDLKGKFNGYTVLGANGLTVALLSDKGRTCSYTFLENEDTVVPERIEEIAVNSVFGEGDGAISVSAEQLVGSIRAELNSAKTALDKKTEEITKLTEKINAMTEAERKRRIKLVKDAIKSEFAENCDAYKNDAELDEHLCDELLTDESVGKYAEMENKDGEFIGDAKARDDVNAKCNKVVRDAKKAKNNSTQIHYAFEDRLNGGSSESHNDVDKLLDEYGTNKKS